MKVKELIEILQSYNEDAEVEIQNGDDGGEYFGSREVDGVVDKQGYGETVVIY